VQNRLIPLAREPLVQFLLIGTCIYGLYALYGTAPEGVANNTIVVDAARVESFVSQWEKRWNRPPTQPELDGVINTFVREEILYRQAIAMGLDEDDPVTRRRMAQKLEFLTSDIALFKEPTTAVLGKYFQDHRARYRDPDRITFRQVFFDPDRRGDSTLDDAADILAQLRTAGDPGSAAPESGDRLMSQASFNEATQREVQRQLGSGFAEAVMQLEPSQWHGPVLSGYGVHLVFVQEYQPAPQPKFEDVAQRVTEDWQKEQQEQFNADFYTSLKSRYEIEIAEPPLGRILQVSPESDTNTDNEAQSASLENRAR
jgi:peptidyl-prolyl cis-trans isomerase C